MNQEESNINNVQRNRYRVLNHLPLLHKKLEVMDALGLTSKGDYWKENRERLKGIMNRQLSAREMAAVLSAQTGRTVEDVGSLLLSCYRTGLCECHITDVCDPQCINCHYANKSAATLPYPEILDYMAHLRPKSLTVTGGGEPNMYRFQGKTMNDVITGIHALYPDISMGLINNNTHIPEGDWSCYLDWQRSSVDASCRETYFTIKGKDKYEQCVKNVYLLLNSPIPSVGIGFLYREENLEELCAFTVEWYKRWLEMSAGKEKFNIQFRPVSPGIESAATADCSALDARMEKELEKMHGLWKADSSFKTFLEIHTNFFSIYNNHHSSYFTHAKAAFGHCANALLHRVLRSNGDEYPDFLLCNSPSCALGNVLTAENRTDERIKIVLSTFYYYHRLGEYCNPEHCRQGWVSHLVEMYRDKDLTELAIPENHFF
jgi:hypothetical protein